MVVMRVTMTTPWKFNKEPEKGDFQCRNLLFQGGPPFLGEPWPCFWGVYGPGGGFRSFFS